MTRWEQVKERCFGALTQAQKYDLEIADALNPGTGQASIVEWLFDCQDQGMLEPDTVAKVLDTLNLTKRWRD